MEKILISACLLGLKCRYDGRDNLHPLIEKLKLKYTLIPICPEVEGGLKIPRIASEIIGDKVINKIGEDNTEYFARGAEIALEKAKVSGAKFAILKTKSPSCGRDHIYDGTFSSTLIDGDGYTVRLFKQAGIRVYTEHEIGELL